MAASNGAQGIDGLRRALLRGLVIPAHPLALNEQRTLDERRQVALTRYYCDAGAGGLADHDGARRGALPHLPAERPQLEERGDGSRKDEVAAYSRPSLHPSLRLPTEMRMSRPMIRKLISTE